MSVWEKLNLVSSLSIKKLQVFPGMQFLIILSDEIPFGFDPVRQLPQSFFTTDSN